jgi:hypothetical protein
VSAPRKLACGWVAAVGRVPMSGGRVLILQYDPTGGIAQHGIKVIPLLQDEAEWLAGLLLDGGGDGDVGSV